MMKQKKLVIILSASVLIMAGCSSTKTYESTIFPKGEWKSVNPEKFSKKDAVRILKEGLYK